MMITLVRDGCLSRAKGKGPGLGNTGGWNYRSDETPDPGFSRAGAGVSLC